MNLHGFSSSKRPTPVRHKRSQSFPDSKGAQVPPVRYRGAADVEQMGMKEFNVSKCDKKPSSNADVQLSLKHEILTLEKRLRNHVSVRCALEKALGYEASCTENMSTEATIPKTTTELIREIAVMEVEVGHLERYLLSLYRKAFDQSIFSKKDEEHNPSLETPRRRRLDFSGSHMGEFATEADPTKSKKQPSKPDSEVRRSQSSMMQHSALSTEGYSLREYHTQPLSMIEYAENSSAHMISLAEHLGARISDHVPTTPNKLSEDMVKCICNVYFKLADPVPENHLSSPTSSFSSLGEYSPRYQHESWGPGYRNDSSFEVRLDNPFHVQGLKDFSGPYSTMIEVNWIYRDSKKLGDVECFLDNFRSLISRLESVDPKRMTHEEKLAFWINIHNALVMHAFLAFGMPQNNMRRMLLLMKAAYNVGGHVVSADFIQNSILGCRMFRPAQWMRLLLPSKSMFKATDEKQAYSIHRPEPLLYFALSSGCHSDPAVRVYNPKRVFQELEAAKDEYIRATFGVGKDHRILLPKIIGSFAKDAGLCQAGIMKMIQQSLPDSLTRCVKKCQQTKNRRNIEWISHNFAFRYLIMKELVK